MNLIPLITIELCPNCFYNCLLSKVINHLLLKLVNLFSSIKFKCLIFKCVIELCSGEKMSNVKWSEYVEVKGRVKLHDFEKYIQELPRSCKKRLMVRKIGACSHPY